MNVLLLALASPAAAADCASAMSTRELESVVADAQRALERLDSDAFRQATDRLTLEVPCVDEPISRHLAAEVHRTRGIRAVGDRDGNAPRMFAAARTIEPAYKFPSSLIPDGNPVRLEYGAFDLSSGGFDTLSPPADGLLQLDGRQSIHRPTDWPTLAQYIGGDGAVRWTAYLSPGDAVPEYPARVDTPAATVANPLLVPTDPIAVLPPPKSRSARTPLLAASAGGLVLTGVLYGLAGVAEAQFKDPTTADPELDGLRSRANSLSIASGFVGVASLGVGVAGFVTPP